MLVEEIRLYILFFLSLFLFNVSICKIYIVIYIVNLCIDIYIVFVTL